MERITATQDQPPGKRSAILEALAFYAAWCLPRLPAILANSVIRDDWVHLPAGHLDSYRPLLAADLWLWQHLVGPSYLLTRWPKAVAGLWLALTAVAIVRIAEEWGARRSAARLIAFAFVLHPILNELTLFNVMAGVNLAMLLAVASHLAVSQKTSAPRLLASSALLALALAGYQIVLMVPLVLLAGETACDPSRWRTHRTLALRLTAIGGGVALYGGYVQFSRLVLGIESWGGRGLGTAGLPLAQRAAAIRHALTNAVADCFQPVLGWSFGIQFAYRAWFWIPLGCAAGLLLVLRRRRNPAWLPVSTLPIALPAIACAYILTLNWIPSGWRVDGPPLLAWLLALAPLFARWDSAAKPAGALLLAWTLLSGGAAVADARLRAAAIRQDDVIAQAVREAATRRGVPASAVLGWDSQGRALAPSRGLLAEYTVVTPATYSNVLSVWSFPSAFLAARGVRLIEGDASPSCEGKVRRADAWAAFFDEQRSTVVICRAKFAG